MKHYLPKNAEDASALILTLLVIVLLSTVVTSFLSSTRTEQTATRNYTSKTQAEQFATSATQQAMATLQSAFNGNGTGTAIVVSQPGAIGKYFGASSGLTGNKTDLFFTASSTNANGTVNMNNLSGPNSTVNTSGISITGNASEDITVYCVDVKNSSGNQTIGRIAYYIDDEGTKVNLNSASSNRSTLNVGNARPLSLFGANLSANLTTFDSIVSGNNTGTRNIKTWTHFFRPEQAVGAGVFTGNAALALASVSTTVPSGGNSTFTKTPWGTDRIYINTLSTNATDGTGDAAVESIYEAFTGKNATTGAASNSTYGATGQMLSKIYGGNFSTKYTDIGVKQIAANILQMRDPNTATVNASFSYQGPLIGGYPIPVLTYDAKGNDQVDGIPTGYLGYAPYPIITEVGVAVGLAGRWMSSAYGYTRLSFHPTIEITNPYPYDYNPAVKAEILFDMKELSIDMETHEGQKRYTWGKNGSVNYVGSNTNPFSPAWRWDNSGGGTFTLPSIPARSKVQMHLAYGTHGYCIWMEGSLSNGNQLKSLSNATVTFNFVKLCVGGNRTTGRNYSIRDWVSGSEAGSINSDIMQPGNALPWIYPTALPWCFQSAYRVGNLPNSSTQRINFLAKTTANATISDSIRNWTSNSSTNWNDPTPSWINSSALTANSTAPELFNSAKARPSFSANTSDPSYNNNVANGVYANATLATDMREPFLATGNYTCPADLGFIPTNKRWRRLRMQPQPSDENTAGLIPDWALLDVIAFGQNATSANYTLTPVNPNGKFNVASGTPPAPRTSGLKALVQMLDTTTTNATLADPMNSYGNVTVNKIRFMGNNSSTATASIVAGNIANMTWSTNSTWSTRRNARGFPSSCLLLPSEVCEIKGVADVVSQGNYNNTTEHFKWNEGRVSAIIPGLTTCSNFFTIFAYAQALDKSGNVDSEALTKTLVEVEITTPATAANAAVYKVKSLYTQSIPMGE